MCIYAPKTACLGGPDASPNRLLQEIVYGECQPYIYLEKPRFVYFEDNHGLESPGRVGNFKWSHRCGSAVDSSFVDASSPLQLSCRIAALSSST